jgi:hypothetical protein
MFIASQNINFCIKHSYKKYHISTYLSRRGILSTYTHWWSTVLSTTTKRTTSWGHQQTYKGEEKQRPSLVEIYYNCKHIYSARLKYKQVHVNYNCFVCLFKIWNVNRDHLKNGTTVKNSCSWGHQQTYKGEEKQRPSLVEIYYKLWDRQDMTMVVSCTYVCKESPFRSSFLIL